MSQKIIRLFPRRTNATPDDQDVRIATTPALWDEADEIHISVAFTWDIAWAEWAAIQWKHVAPVKLGGPAFNEPGGGGFYPWYVHEERICHYFSWLPKSLLVLPGSPA